MSKWQVDTTIQPTQNTIRLLNTARKTASTNTSTLFANEERGGIAWPPVKESWRKCRQGGLWHSASMLSCSLPCDARNSGNLRGIWDPCGRGAQENSYCAEHDDTIIKLRHACCCGNVLVSETTIWESTVWKSTKTAEEQWIAVARWETYIPHDLVAEMCGI